MGRGVLAYAPGPLLTVDAVGGRSRPGRPVQLQPALVGPISRGAGGGLAWWIQTETCYPAAHNHMCRLLCQSHRNQFERESRMGSRSWDPPLQHAALRQCRGLRFRGGIVALTPRRRSLSRAALILKESIAQALSLPGGEGPDAFSANVSPSRPRNILAVNITPAENWMGTPEHGGHGQYKLEEGLHRMEWLLVSTSCLEAACLLGAPFPPPLRFPVSHPAVYWPQRP